MNRTQVGITILVAWVAVGLVVGIVMGRRGHHTLLWMILGAVFGPFMIPLAMRSLRDDPTFRSQELVVGSAGTGSVDVLVGIDGSAESEAALRTAVGLLGSRLGRLTLADVVVYESVGSTPPWDDEAQALDILERLRNSMPDLNPGTTILVGQPATALMKEAVEGGYEILAIGRRGHGAAKTLMGSTATRLTRGANTPVLIV